MIAVEVPRTAALKLMASVPAAKRAVTRISIERQLLQLFGSGLTSADLAEVLDTAEVTTVRALPHTVTAGAGDQVCAQVAVARTAGATSAYSRIKCVAGG